MSDRFDAPTRKLLATLTAEPRIVRETRGDSVRGAAQYSIAALVQAGLADRAIEQSVSARGVAVAKTLLRLRAVA